MNFKNVLMLFCVLSLLVACSDNKDNPAPEPIPISKDKKITSYKISKTLNNLDYDIVGVVNEQSKTITLKTTSWINTPNNLIATVVGIGEITVGEVIQESDVTANDFSKREITYTVSAEDESTVNYTVILISPQTSGLPVIKIDIEDNQEVVEKTDEYLNANFALVDNNNPDFDVSAPTGIRGRGNSTWSYPKKPYRLKFDEKTSLFGHGAEKSWVLLAAYLDPTLLMTSVAFEFGHRLKLEYTNHNHNVELFVNGKYRGNYVLTEQVQVNNNRVNIDKKKGFLVELDMYFDEEYKFKTNRLQLPVMLKSPEITAESEMDFVREYIQNFEDALFEDFETSNYKDYIDLPSLIDFMLINEITSNRELKHPKSTYAYKDKDGKMFFGPLWDFDWAFGKDESLMFSYFNSSEQLFFYPTSTNDEIGARFFCRFMQDPSFVSLYKNRWNELHAAGLLDMTDFIDEEAKKLQYSQQLNFEKWSNDTNYDSQIARMKKWMTQRIDFLDKEINSWN